MCSLGIKCGQIRNGVEKLLHVYGVGIAVIQSIIKAKYFHLKLRK